MPAKASLAEPAKTCPTDPVGAYSAERNRAEPSHF